MCDKKKYSQKHNQGVIKKQPQMGFKKYVCTDTGAQMSIC